MSNDITGINSGRRQKSGDRKFDSTAGGSKKTQHGTSAKGSETVDMTDMASRLKSLEKQLTEQPDINQDNVNRIRDAISRGEYRIDPDRVADKMIDFDKDI